MAVVSLIMTGVSAEPTGIWPQWWQWTLNWYG